MLPCCAASEAARSRTKVAVLMKLYDLWSIVL
jgi:hypothetical protein